MNPVIETMLNHKSIRKFIEKPVPGEQLDLILRSAQSASTSSFLQAYSIINIVDKEKRSKLRSLSGDQEYIETAAVFLVFCADLNRMKSVYAQAGKTSDYESGWTETFIIATVDTALAGQNALLAAESLGLGGVYIGGIRNNPEAVCELLNLPDEVYPVFGMCLGYPNQSPEVKERLPAAIVIHEDAYKELDPEVLHAYDEKIQSYYLNRTHGKIRDTWSDSILKKFEKERREHMKSFLQNHKFMTK